MSSRITVAGPPVDRAEEILTPAALDFLADLHERFAPRRDELLALRQVRRDAVAVGEPMDFLHETAAIRSGDWTVAPIPDYLADRRVEITGPTDRKMTINALNSGAKIWLADLEDANTPAWANVISGQVNLHDAIRRTITLDQDGKSYRLNDGELAVIVTRPRGWHLPEKHLTVSTAGRWSVRWSTSGCTSSTTPPNCWTAAPGRRSTCRRWNPIWRPGSGPRCSRSPRSGWASSTAPSGPPC